ncbi:MAG: DoxX family protein [Deltaproteobacteria bacterium]|nr:DoxX family protein [Deltaproteobacteria bacterium]
MERVKLVVRWVMTIGMVFIGVGHFIKPEPFVVIVPEVLPHKLLLVYISGVAEIAGGLGLILPQTRKLAAWGLILLYLAVFPANINMAINDLPLNGKHMSQLALWGRLPVQALFIALAYWQTRPDGGRVRAS